jgi:DNA-binding beta-propeller fold protein YncE
MMGPMLRSARRIGGLIALAALLLPASALAAGPFGSLSQLPSPNNCVGPSPECGTAPIGSVNGAQAVVVSPDGKNVYVVDGSDASISEFARGPDGSLTQLANSNNCIAQSGSTSSCGNKTANGLDFPGAIAISPDGKSVYVAGEDSNFVGAIAVLARNADGSLSPRGCIGENAAQAGASSSCASTGHGLDTPAAVEVSPDGNSVYVADSALSSVAWLTRAADGSLSQSGGAANCLQESGANPFLRGPDCSPETAHGLSGADSLSISSDGHNVYAGGSGSIAELARNADGSLTQLSGANNCIEEHGGSDCGTETGLGLRRIVSLDISPDGRNLYSSAGDYTGALAEFMRNADGSLTQLSGANSCIEENPSGDGTQAAEGCGTNTGHGLGSGGTLAVSPDGANVYVGATGDDCNSPCHNAVAEFARNASGSLTQLASPNNCIEEQGGTNPPDCGDETGRGLSSGAPPGMAISPGADSVYVTGTSPGSIAEFARLLPTLTVSLSGSGSGTVSDGTGAISCSPTCSHAYPIGQVVTLTASPRSGSSFVSWSGGGCSGTATCKVTMTVGTAVTATFNVQTAPTPVLTGVPPSVSGTSAAFTGSVDPGGIVTTAFFQYGLDPKYTGGGPISYTQSTPAQVVGSDFTTHIVTASVTGLVPNALYHMRLVATNSAGTTFGPDVAFTTLKTAPPGPPALGKTFNISPVSGVVLILVNGQLVPLTELEQIPKSTVIDALHGTIGLTTAALGGPGAARDAAAKGNKTKVKTQSGTFGGAIFKITQATRGAGKGLATLTLVENAFKGAPTYATCKAKKAADASAAALSSRTLQLLRANAKGKFRTSGRYSAATVRGTKWTIADRCDGTLTHDITHSVAVTDFVRHKTIILHAGRSYLAKPKK